MTNIKISLSTFFLFIALIVIVFLTCFIIYISKENKQISNKNTDLNNKLALIANEKVENTLNQETNIDKNTSTNSTITNNTTETNISNNKVEDYISTNDKVAICSLDNNHFYGYLDNGVLYYVIYEYTPSYDNTPLENKVTKYEKLNNIKKIKYYNYGTGTSPYLVLLTEDGKVYTLDLYNSLEKNQTNLENATLLEESKNLNVKDFKLEQANYKFNLILTLNDGNTKTVTLFVYPQ